VRFFLIALCAGAWVATIACGAGTQTSAPAAQDSTSGDTPLPAPAAPLPITSTGLAADLTQTTHNLRAETRRWITTGEPARGGPPPAVTLLALRHQRLYRSLSARPAQAAAVLRRLPPSVQPEARDTLNARRALTAIPVSPNAPRPRIRLGAAQPADRLRAHYDEAQKRFGTHWSVLAAVNFVESYFGRLRNASYAGARGPMQFIPATWAQYGMGGNIHDPRDAILGAANYLRASGAPRRLAKALYAYNHSTAYVRAILSYARRIRIDERAFYTYYSWQVYVAGPDGRARRVTGPR
jgi:hypothetical protein